MFRIYEKDFHIYNYTLWSRARFFSPWDCFPVVDVFVLSESSGIAQQIWTENCHNMSERWHHPKKISSWSRYSSKVTSLSKWLIFFMKTSTCTTKLLVWKDWESVVHKQEKINHKCSKLMYIVLLLCHLVLVLLVHLLSTELLGVIFNKQFYANIFVSFENSCWYERGGYLTFYELPGDENFFGTNITTIAIFWENGKYFPFLSP